LKEILSEFCFEQLAINLSLFGKGLPTPGRTATGKVDS
jgi:hypothetical protein